MKKFLTAALLSLPMMSTAGVLDDSIPVCTTLTYLDEARTAKELNDTRAARYLLENNHCVMTKEGLEYSVIDVNYAKSPEEWAKIRLYLDDGGTLEVYTQFGNVQ